MDQEQQDDKQQGNGHSSIDRANQAYKGFKKARKTYNRLRRAKMGIQAARLATQAVAAFAGGGEVLLIILLILLGIGIIVILFMTIFGGGESSNNNGLICHNVTVTGAPGTGSKIQSNLAAAKNVINFGGAKNPCTLYSSWCGATQLFPSNAQKDYIWGIYAKVFGSTRYAELVGSRKVYIYFYSGPSGYSSGGVYGENIMTWRGLLSRLYTDGTKKTLIHELNHIIDKRHGNTRISDGGTSYGGEKYSRTSLASKDSSCYNSCPIVGSTQGPEYIKTYGYRQGSKCDSGGTDANHESFAEAVADYVMCTPKERFCNYTDRLYSSGIFFNDTNGNGQCPATYAWIKKNIFGGDDFFGAGSGTSTTTVQVCVTPTPEPTGTAPPAGSGTFPWSEFDKLVAGQGRNTTALGNSAAAFVRNVKSRVGSGTNDQANATYLTKIYNASVAKKVNPVIVLTIWGVEQGFRANTSLTFGCFYDSMTGFDLNLQCAVNTLNNKMNMFNPPSTKIHSVNPEYPDPSCTYTDRFSYAYEWYTPVCHAKDGNNAYRTNFIRFYKKLMGL